jgi:PAS domain S-box-containing protein
MPAPWTDRATMSGRPLPRSWGIFVAVAGVTLVTLARFALAPALRDQFPYLGYLAVLMLTAWAADAAAALLALLLGAVAAVGSLLLPPGLEVPLSPRHGFGLALYLAVGGLAILLSDSERRARRRGEAESTERRRAEDALRASNRQFGQLVEAMPQIAFMSAPDGASRYINGRWAAFTGLDPAESDLDRSLLDVVHPDDHDRLTSTWAASLASGTEYECQFRLRRHDGEYRWFLARAVPVRDEHGTLTAWFGTSTDIEDQKRSEESLRRGESEYRSLFENAGVGNAEIDLETGRFVRVNRTYCAITGYDADALLGMTYLDVTHPDDRDRTHGLVEPFLREHAGAFEMEKRYVRRDGRTIHVQVCGTLIRDADGRPIRLLGCVEDITQRRRIEEERRDADRRKDEFLAMLSHELRNPLAPIRNALSVLSLADADPGATAWAREVIDRQTGVLTHLVDDLLDVARITQGKVTLHRATVRLAGVVTAAVEASQPLIDARRHRLEVDLPDEPLYVDGDTTRLSQVVLNLLNNAAKYTPDGGHIRLSLAREADRAVLRVADDGDGLAPETLATAFDLFTQADRSLDRAQGGLGIGLTLVRRLVELHGGCVDAHSDGPGLGAEFVVRLPLVPAPAAPVTPPGGVPRLTDAAIRPLRILVVDDNHDAADTLARLLRRLGHEVHTCYDGQEACRQALAFAPGVVLLDLGLPGLDGFEVARRLRREPALDGLRILALTGYGSESDRRRAVEAGFDGHLVKPVALDQLLQLLARASHATR